MAVINTLNRYSLGEKRLIGLAFSEALHGTAYMAEVIVVRTGVGVGG